MRGSRGFGGGYWGFWGAPVIVGELWGGGSAWGFEGV